MQVNYEELMQEIKEITTVDGFVAACLEIRESMFFYERDLMLAAFSASLELLTVAALFSAALKGSRELHEVEKEIGSCIDDLLEELGQYQLPLDIQYVSDRYAQEAGFNTSQRMPVYMRMIRCYAAGSKDDVHDLDSLLRRAHRAIYENGPHLEKELINILGQVGAQMLRGAGLRPLWLRISHPRLYHVLVGLQTMMNNFRVTPYFTFPLESISIERQKRKKIGDNVVLDLGPFRNFREGGSGYTDLNVSLSRDEYDYFLENLLSNPDYLKIKPDEHIVAMIAAILEARLVNEEIEDYFVVKALLYCDLWRLSEVSGAALELLSVLDPEEPLFYGTWSLLKGFGGKSLPAIRRFVRANRQSPLLIDLAALLSHGNPGKRKWNLLQEVFEHYPREDETKLRLASSIAHYGGPEAVQYLEGVLLSTNSSKNSRYRMGLEEALEQAREKRG